MKIKGKVGKTRKEMKALKDKKMETLKLKI